MGLESNAELLNFNYVKVTNVNIFNVIVVDHAFCILYI